MLRCPKCSSSGVKKSSAIYEQGVSTSRARSNGLWLSRRGIGMWSGHSTSERISGAAARNAPTGFGLEGLTFVGVFVVALLIGFTSAGDISSFVMAVPIACVIAVVAAVLVGISQKEQRATLQASYNRQWYCSKCGNKFEIDLETASPVAPDARASAGRLQGQGAGPVGFRADYASRVLDPVQRAKVETERDGTWLRTIAARATGADQSFDPCSPTALDLGAVSRLASLGFLQYDQERDVFSLSERGAKRAAEIG